MAAACRRIYDVILFQGIIQEDLHAFPDRERTYPAGSMADIFLHLIAGDHPGFGMESLPELFIIDPGVSREQDQHRFSVYQKGKGLGNSAGFRSKGRCRFLDRRAGLSREDNSSSSLCHISDHYTINLPIRKEKGEPGVMNQGADPPVHYWILPWGSAYVSGITPFRSSSMYFITTSLSASPVVEMISASSNMVNPSPPVRRYWVIASV